MSNPRTRSIWWRIMVGALLLVGIFVLPYYVTYFLILVFVFIFDFYLEAVVLAFIYELMYSRLNDPIYSLKVFPVALGVFVVWEYFLRTYIRVGTHV